MKNKDFQSSEILLDIAKSEYQNEFSRTSVIDTKVGITLPVIATYFFLVLQFENVKDIFMAIPNTQNIATVLFSIFTPVLYLAIIVCAGVALVYLFLAIITQSYKTVDPRCHNNKKEMSQPKETFSAVMITYYIRACDHNHVTNNKRVKLYKHGWCFAMVSLGLFVCYVFVK